MAKDEALKIRLEVTLAKLEKQLDRAVKKNEVAAKKIVGTWQKSNRVVTRSAEQSADAIGKEMERLRQKYDPVYAASKKYEAALKELNLAHKTGVIDTVKYEAALEQLNNELARSGTGVTGVVKTTKGLGSAFSGAQHQIQNAAFQIGDFAVQVGSGQRASTALAQQLPQLLGGFGALGAVMGAVVAIGVPLATYFLSTGESAKELQTKLQELETAVAEYTSSVRNAKISTAELEEKYGSASGAAKVFLSALRDLNKASSLEQLQIAIDDITSKFGSLSRDSFAVLDNRPIREIELALINVREEFDLTEEAAGKIVLALEDLQNAQGVQAQVDALVSLKSALEASLGPLGSLKGETREWVEFIIQAGEQWTQVQGAIEDSNSSILDFISGVSSAVGGMDGLISQADTLAGKMFNAAKAAWEFAGASGAARIAAQQRVDNLPTTFAYQQYGTTRSAAPKTPVKPPKPRGGGGRRRSGGGGGGRSKRQEKPFFDGVEADIKKLERQIEMIGKTDQQVAALTAKYKLLDLAKKRGLDLNKKSAETGRTLREEIEKQADAVGVLTQKAKEYANQQSSIEHFNKTLKDSLLDAAVSSGSLGDALEGLIDKLKRAALEAAFFGSGPLSGLFGTKLAGGNIFGKLLGGLFGSANGNVFSGGAHVQAYADGGVVGGPTMFPMQGGKTGLMGEAGPEAIMPLTRVGGKLGVAATGGAVDVSVRIDDSGQMRGTIERISGNVAARVVQGNNVAVTQAQRRR